MGLIEIIKLLPLIEKFVSDLGNNFVIMEEKLSFVENDALKLNNCLASETEKVKKSTEIIKDLREENKFLK